MGINTSCFNKDNPSSPEKAEQTLVQFEKKIRYDPDTFLRTHDIGELSHVDFESLIYVLQHDPTYAGQNYFAGSG